MAKPQTENGYTKLANELLEEICVYGFNASQLFIIMTVWRFTYGFNRKEHGFAVSFLQEATRLSEKTVKNEVAALVSNKVLKVTQEATKKTARVLSFNKNYEEWLTPRRGVSMEQLSLFDDDSEGNDSTPQKKNQRGSRVPLRGEVEYPSNGHSEGNQSTPKKEIKIFKENIKEIIYKRFNEFWSYYPKRVGKKDAERHFTRLHSDKNFSWDDFIKGTKAYVEYCQRENRFLKDGSAFVNQETYKDFLEDMPTTNIRKTSVNYDKSTKLDKNKELLFGGNQKNGRTRREVNTSQSFGSLPEPT